MLKISKIIILLVVMLFAIPLTNAQDSIYADIPMSRGDDGAFILGDPSADVKIIEFSDFLCPSCQDYKNTIDPFIEQFVATGQAQFEFRMIPIVNPNISTFTGNLVECADIQSEGLFWEAHDVMFNIMSTVGYSNETVTTFADELGLDETELALCAQTATQVATDGEYAREIGITGTPTIAVQFGDADPVVIALPQINQYESVLNAIRPTTNEVVEVAFGRYSGIPTYRTDDGGLVLGDPDAPLHIVAFEDFMCPHCQEYQPTLHTFIEQYVATGQAKFEYRFYPLVNPQFSMLTARVADCVALQDLGKFWEAHDLIFEFAASQELDNNVASVVSMLVDVDPDAVNECINLTLQPFVDIQAGQEARITGTPGVRARNANGELEVIFAGQQPLERGAIPLEVLAGLAEGSPDFSIGEPEISLLSDTFLTTDSLLLDEPCSIPCWENITPGETTMAEAIEIIQGLEQFTILQENLNNIVFTVDETDICCRVISQDNSGSPDGVVGAIFLQLAPNNTLGQFIEVHGNPVFVSGEPYSDSEAIITLFYPEIQTIINIVVEGENGQISEDSPIFSAVYASSLLIESAISNSPLDNWKGFLTYSEYIDGEFDYNPGR